jgi:hypothetical protein
MSLPVFAHHSISNILLARSVLYRPLHHSEYGTLCTMNISAADSRQAVIVPLGLFYHFVSELPCTRAMATEPECKSNELLFSTAKNRLNLTAFTMLTQQKTFSSQKHTKQLRHGPALRIRCSCATECQSCRWLLRNTLASSRVRYPPAGYRGVLGRLSLKIS